MMANYEYKKVFSFKGVAEDITSPSARKVFRSRTLTHIRIGTFDLCLTCEFEAGWPPALRLVPGTLYEVTVHAVKGMQPVFAAMPKDVLKDGGIVFYSPGRVLQAGKDESDRRKSVKGFLASWTDGLSLRSSPASSKKLKEGVVYQVTVMPIEK